MSKKQRLLTKYVSSLSDEDDSSLELTESIPSVTSASDDDVRQLKLARKFMPRWKYLFPWIEIEGEGTESELLYCRECKMAGLKNDFACGKSRPPKGWKKEYLRRHADSSDHAMHAPTAIAISKTAVSMFKAPKFLASEAETVGLLVNIHFLVRLSMNKGAALHSLTDFQLAFYADEQMEIEQESFTLSNRDGQLSKTHRSSYSIWEFVHALNGVVEADDMNKLKQARYFSLLLDESNDISNTKNLLIYCQYLDSMKKKVELKFMKLLSLEECDAQAIFIAVTDLFSQNEVATQKLIMFTSGGASVMLGRSNGVQAKLKAIVPHLLEFHCVAHREALAVSHAYNSIDNFVQLESTLRAIYSYFSHSSTRLERLKLVFNVLDKKFVRLQKLFGIHWLNRLQALKAIVKSYEALILYFDNRANEYRFVVCLHFLCDVLST